MSREAMQQALEALENLTCTVRTSVDVESGNKAITALRRELEKPVDEPVGEVNNSLSGCVNWFTWKVFADGTKLYTRPQPAAQWVGLTDEERNKLWRDVIGWGDPSHDDVDLMKAIEAKLKEKNT